MSSFMMASGLSFPAFRRFTTRGISSKKVALRSGLRGDDGIDEAYGTCMGSTLFQKFLSKTVVGKLVTKAVGGIPVVGKAAQAAVTAYSTANIQKQPAVSMPAAPPVTVADVTAGMKKPFPMVPVAIGAGVLFVAAMFMLKKK